MKQITPLNSWTYILHKVLLVSGYAALLALAAGADVKVKKSDLNLREAMPSQPAEKHDQKILHSTLDNTLGGLKFNMQTLNHKEV